MKRRKTQTEKFSGRFGSALAFMALLFAVCAGSLQAQNPSPYFTIGDISLYESADSIVGEGIQGHVSFDATTNTLFLDNAAVPAIWVYSKEKCFNVKLSGNNSITGMMTNNDSCAFIGPGTLTIGSPSVSIALDCARTDYLALTEGATLEITASDYGIFTLYDDIWDSIAHYPNLVVDNSSLIVTAPYCCQFVWFWWLSECHVVVPQDFEYQLDTWTYLSSGTIHDYLEIRPGTVGVPAHESCNWQAWGVDGGIRIDGLSGNQTVEVVNILGQTVHSTISSGTNAFIPLKAGLYLVRVNNHTVKTVVN